MGELPKVKLQSVSVKIIYTVDNEIREWDGDLYGLLRFDAGKDAWYEAEKCAKMRAKEDTYGQLGYRFDFLNNKWVVNDH